jgi:predicted RNA polymerase sigma factor
MGTADVEAVWRIEPARIVAAPTRLTGDFALAEGPRNLPTSARPDN